MEHNAGTAGERIRGYVAARLGAAGHQVGTSYVGAGLIAWDDCCGMLVVVPERVFRAAVFPAEGPDRNGCYGGDVGLSIVVLWLACMPTVDDRGQVPSEADMRLAYATFLNGAAVVWNALADLPVDWGWLHTGLNQTFIGTEGGCIGVESRVTVGINEAEWCVQYPFVFVPPVEPGVLVPVNDGGTFP